LCWFCRSNPTLEEKIKRPSGRRRALSLRVKPSADVFMEELEQTPPGHDQARTERHAFRSSHERRPQTQCHKLWSNDDLLHRHGRIEIGAAIGGHAFHFAFQQTPLRVGIGVDLHPDPLAGPDETECPAANIRLRHQPVVRRNIAKQACPGST